MAAYLLAMASKAIWNGLQRASDSGFHSSSNGLQPTAVAMASNPSSNEQWLAMASNLVGMASNPVAWPPTY